jgi:hypothetical protein
MKLGQPNKTIIDNHAKVCKIKTVKEIFSGPLEIENHVLIRILIAVTATNCYRLE